MGDAAPEPGFQRLHGITPMAFLARTRTRAAERLVRDSRLGLDQIAALSGFGSRQTLFRQLRRHRGDGGRALRRAAAAALANQAGGALCVAK